MHECVTHALSLFLSSDDSPFSLPFSLSLSLSVSFSLSLSLCLAHSGQLLKCVTNFLSLFLSSGVSPLTWLSLSLSLSLVFSHSFSLSLYLSLSLSRSSVLANDGWIIEYWLTSDGLWTDRSARTKKGWIDSYLDSFLGKLSMRLTSMKKTTTSHNIKTRYVYISSFKTTLCVCAKLSLNATEAPVHIVARYTNTTIEQSSAFVCFVIWVSQASQDWKLAPGI